MIRLKSIGVWLADDLSHHIDEERNEKGELVAIWLNFGVQRKRISDVNDIALIIDKFGLKGEDVKVAVPVNKEPEKSEIEKLLEANEAKPAKPAKADK